MVFLSMTKTVYAFPIFIMRATYVADLIFTVLVSIGA
jgi:hypothetical protein